MCLFLLLCRRLNRRYVAPYSPTCILQDCAPPGRVSVLSCTVPRRLLRTAESHRYLFGHPLHIERLRYMYSYVVKRRAEEQIDMPCMTASPSSLADFPSTRSPRNRSQTRTSSTRILSYRTFTTGLPADVYRLHRMLRERCLATSGLCCVVQHDDSGGYQSLQHYLLTL